MFASVALAKTFFTKILHWADRKAASHRDPLYKVEHKDVALDWDRNFRRTRKTAAICGCHFYWGGGEKWSTHTHTVDSLKSMTSPGDIKITTPPPLEKWLPSQWSFILNARFTVNLMTDRSQYTWLHPFASLLLLPPNNCRIASVKQTFRHSDSSDWIHVDVLCADSSWWLELMH